MDEVKRKRNRKLVDSSQWTVKDCLESALDDIERGDTKANKAIILLINENAPEPFAIEAYRANINRVEEIGYLDLHKSIKLNDWQGK